MSETITEFLHGIPTELFVGGKWVPASSGGRFEVIDPATGSTIATVADGGLEEPRPSTPLTPQRQTGQPRHHAGAVKSCVEPSS